MGILSYFKKETFAAKPTAKSLYSPQATELFTRLLFEYDPDEVLLKTGLQKYELGKLLYDDEISAAMETRFNAVLSTTWRLEPWNRAAKFVDEQLQKRFEQIIRAAWRCIPFGYSVLETVYSKAMGGITWAETEEKPFEWFKPQKDGTLRYFPSDGTGGIEGIEVDTVYKFFLTRRNPTYQNPYGESLLSKLYWPWFFRSQGWKFWARFLERFGSPLLIGKIGSIQAAEAGNGQKTPADLMAEALATAQQSAVLAISKEDDVIISGATQAGQSFEMFSTAVDKRIQKVILGQTLTTDVGGTGSYAAATVHNDVRNDRRLSDIRLVSDTVQRMINALCLLNNLQAPKFVMEDGKGLESERAERDVKLVNAGIIKLTDKYLMDRYDFETGDFEIPEAAPVIPVNLPQEQKLTAKSGEFFGLIPKIPEGQRFTPDQQAVEDLGTAAAKTAKSPISAKDIKAAIDAAESPEDLENRLAELFEGADSEEFKILMEQSLFAADVMGYAHVEEQSA